MFCPLRFIHCFPSFLASTSLLTGILAVASPVAAQGTRLWLQSQVEEFEKGTPSGVAIESDGHLRQSAGLTELLTTPSTFVWSLAADKSGRVFAATGSPALVLRLAQQQNEKPITLFETRDLSVQALRIGPDGLLYAATLPSGKVYKLNPDAAAKLDEANAPVVFDPSTLTDDWSKNVSSGQTKPTSSAQSHYIWDLIFDSSGRLYIAAGNPGAVYRVDVAKPDTKPELFFKSDEAHIRTLAWDANENLIAGSDGSGLVYRIDPHGKGYVLFEAPRREITSVALGSNGTIYAACIGDKSHNPLPPLPVQGVASITITVAQPQSLQAANASTSVPEGTEIYALAEGQAPRMVWSGKDEIVYSLASRPDGLLALSGNRGRILLIHDDGSYADVAHVQAQQGLAWASTKGLHDTASLLIGAGNTGRIYLLGSTATHEYASDVLDAGAFAHFGRVEVEPGSSDYELFTRSGNVEQPVRGWSDWLPVQNGAVASPPGRFLQWKAVLHPGGILGSVGINYLAVNSAPVVDDIVVVPGARLNPQNQINLQSQNQNVNIAFPTPNQNPAIAFDTSASQPLQALKDHTAATVRWAAHDDDGDDLIFSLYLRGDGESVWRLLKDKITDKAYSFDASLVPDGGYRIKVVASDSPSHSPGEALTGDRVSDRFVIDTTPPVITNLKVTPQSTECGKTPCRKPLVVRFDAEDASSPISHAEYSFDAGPWQFIDPVGKLSDSNREHYEFGISLEVQVGNSVEHLITVRAYDRYDNVSVAKTVIPAQEP